MNTTIEELISNIAPLHEIQINKRNSYIILGKPGCGKTTLASKLAEFTRSHLINMDTAFQLITKSSEDHFAQLQQTLLGGGVIGGETFYDALLMQLKSDSLHTKGFVLEDLPMNIKSPNLFDQIDSLVSVIQNFNVVLVDLRISDQDLLRRKVASWVDPVTNVSYPGQQVLYSRRRRREGWVDGEEDTVYNAEKAASSLSNAKPKKDSLEEEDEDEERVEEVKATVTTQTLKPFKNQMSYPILSEKILDRLIKLPENDPEKVSEEIASYKIIEEKMEEVKRKYFNALQVVELDATQHPEQVFDQMKARMEARGYSIYAPLCEPLKLIPPERGVADMTDQDLFKFYLNAGLREGEPEREVSIFKRNCPVTWATDNKLCEGKGEFCAVYKGEIYFFTSEEYLNQFIVHPDRHLAAPRMIPSKTVAFIGPPLPIPLLIAKAIAKKYNLGYLNPEETILKWEESNWSCLTSEDDERLKNIAGQAHAQIQRGSAISSEVYVDLVEYLINEHKSSHTQLSKRAGWVLDGLPCSADQVQLMAAKDILPQSVFYIKAEYSEQLIRDSFQKQEAIPMNRSSFAYHQKQPFSETTFTECSVANLECLKELNDKGISVTTVNWAPSHLSILTKVLETLDIFVPQALRVKSFTSPPIFGETKDYCPVTIKKSNRLQKGDSNYMVKFMGYTYCFVNEDEMLEFCSQPYYYLKEVKIPPPRIIVLGVSGSGKTVVTSSLSKKWELPVINFANFCTSTDFGLEEINKEIKTCILSNSPLSGATITQIFTRLYVSEPYASTGFLLEGFPLLKSDLDTLLKQKLSPDAFLVLQVDSAVAAKRIFSSRKADIMKEEEERLQKTSILLKGDLSSPLLLPLSMSDEKLMEDLIIKIEQQNNAISDYAALLDAWGSVSNMKISAGRCLRRVMGEIENKLAPILNNRNALLHSTNTLDEKVAKNLLDFGVKRFSHLGKFCPVTIHENGLINPSNFGNVTIQCGDYVYFVKDKLEASFHVNPSLYISQTHIQPVLASNCCIVGNPKSGKSALAEALARELDAIPLTVTLILQTILDGNENTALFEKIRKTLHAGKTVADQQVVDAIITITNRIAASGKGWILDGFPNTIDQANLLEKANFQPHFIFNITLPESVIVSRTTDDLNTAVLPALNAIDAQLLRNSEWKKCIDFTMDLYQGKYSNWVNLDGLRSKWSLKEEARLLCVNALRKRQTYLQLKTEGKAAPASNVGLSTAFMLKHRSKFQDYCPYELVEFNRLNTQTGRFHAEYKDLYYCLSSEEALTAFLKSPERYIDQSLPDILPRVSSKSALKFPKKLQLLGYCSVTFAHGPVGFGSIVVGSLDYIAEYNSELYSFESREKLELFMSTPWKYSNLTLPKKLPPPIAPIPVSGLPISGYLEQSLASALTKALVALGKARPKHPFKEIDQSACEFLGLYLKATNPQTKDWVKKSHSRKLNSYIVNCDLLKSLQQKLSTATAISAELESSVNAFLSLK